MGTDKSTSSNDTSHRIQNYEKYFNKAAKRRCFTKLRSFQKYVGKNYVYMAGGLPNGNLFPIAQVQMRLRDGRTVKIREDEMKVAQQYGETIGLTPLVEWLTELQRRLHNPPTLPAAGVSPSANSDMMVITTIGSQEGMSKVMESMLEEGDSVLLEKSTYPTIMNIIEPLGCKAIAVKNDVDGMITSDLEEILSSWNEAISGRRPRLIYSVPTGANPTGANWTLQREKEVYALARKYDMLILEDDPYYLLQFERPLRPSLLSLDEDGRVLRCDSFSKVIAPGSRIGYLSGPRQFVNKIVQWVETSVGASNGISQTVIWKVLQTMGQDGFIEHTNELAQIYHSRAKLLMDIADIHLKGLVEWSPPAGGMFLWMKLLGVEDSVQVCEKLVEKGAVFVEGFVFSPAATKSPYIRISFSYASQNEMDTAFRWLAEILKEETKKQ